jgi:hypothetical protein
LKGTVWRPLLVEFYSIDHSEGATVASLDPRS